MRYDLTKRVAYCVDGKFLRGTRRPPRPGPTLIIIYTFIIWPTAPRPGRTDPARTPHAPRSSGPTGRHLSSPGRLVAFNLIKSVTLMSTTITLHETFLQHEHPRHEPNCEHGLRSAAQPGPWGRVCALCSLLPTCTGRHDSRSRSAETTATGNTSSQGRALVSSVSHQCPSSPCTHNAPQSHTPPPSRYLLAPYWAPCAPIPPRHLPARHLLAPYLAPFVDVQASSACLRASSWALVAGLVVDVASRDLMPLGA